MTLSLPAHRPPNSSSDGPASEPPSNGTSAHDAIDDLIPPDLPEAQQDLLRRLFEQVDAAADTIERLRAENRRLRERVAMLEQRPEVPDDQTMVLLDDDPNTLRSQVDRFIGAIDAYLDGDEAEGSLPSEAMPDASAADEPDSGDPNSA
jgi:hypothetical protein